MNESAEAQTLTSSLLSTVRLQRHLGARIVICTQELMISPALLNLCSITVVHRFTSPEWMHSLRAYLVAAAPDATEPSCDASDQQVDVEGVRVSRAKNQVPKLPPPKNIFQKT